MGAAIRVTPFPWPNITAGRPVMLSGAGLKWWPMLGTFRQGASQTPGQGRCQGRGGRIPGPFVPDHGPFYGWMAEIQTMSLRIIQKINAGGLVCDV